MRRNIRFKPSLRDTMLANQRALEFMALGAPAEKRDAANAMVSRMAAAIPPAPKKRQPRMDGVDIDAIHGTKRAMPRDLEGPVVRAISELLAVHPRVIWAARFNSGAASYDAGSGRYAPVWFHKFVRSPNKMRMVDFFGLMSCGLPIAVEAKAPGWTKPRDDREREQMAFLNMVALLGGVALFATSADQVAAALK